MLEGFGQNFSLSSPQTRLAVTIWSIVCWWELTFVWCLLCVIPISRIKLVLRLAWKFSNSGGYNLDCCFGFSLNLEFWVLGWFSVLNIHVTLSLDKRSLYMSLAGISPRASPVLSVACLLTNNPTPIYKQNPNHFYGLFLLAILLTRMDFLASVPAVFSGLGRLVKSVLTIDAVMVNSRALRPPPGFQHHCIIGRNVVRLAFCTWGRCERMTVMCSR
jgi:hypothetical protein